MKALLFPGQGSQIVGMGSEFYKNFDFVKKIFKEADETLKINITKIILEGPEEELKLTENTQPAIMVVSYSIFQVMKKEFGLDINNFKYFAGHSLGEYSALVSNESLKFSDALYLLRERGKAMQAAVPIGQGGMLAVLGCNFDEVNKFILNLDGDDVCEIANDNADGQIILSGKISSIKKMQLILKENKKKSILLPVSAPFHSSLMKSAAELMKNKITSVNFKDPKIEIISNVTASPEKNSTNIKKLLIDQIFSKVRWRESIINMSKNGITHFVEVGPGKVLSGLVKRIEKNLFSASINSIEDIKEYTNEFKK